MEERRTAAILLLGDHPSEMEDAADLGAHGKGLDIVSSYTLPKFGNALDGKASRGFEAVIVGLGTGKDHIQPDEKARNSLVSAMEAGKDIISCFSVDISKDEGLSSKARKAGVTITCPGHPTKRPPIAKLLDPLPCPVLLAYGKGSRRAMLQAIEAARMGNVAWISTTAAGCMMGPSAGLKVEVVAGDFVSGAIEEMIRTVNGERRPSAIIIECMGTLDDIITSPVSIGIVHGSRATHMLKVQNVKKYAALVGASLGKDIQVIEPSMISELIRRP